MARASRRALRLAASDMFTVVGGCSIIHLSLLLCLRKRTTVTSQRSQRRHAEFGHCLHLGMRLGFGCGDFYLAVVALVVVLERRLTICLLLYLIRYLHVWQFTHSGTDGDIYWGGLRFTLLAHIGYDRNDINLRVTYISVTAGIILGSISWHALRCHIDGVYPTVLVDASPCREYPQDDLYSHAVVRALMLFRIHSLVACAFHCLLMSSCT